MGHALPPCPIPPHFSCQVEDSCRFEVVCAGCAENCSETLVGVTVVDEDTVPSCALIPTGVVSTDSGATVESLVLEAGYYRVSKTSDDVVECHREESCLGGSDVDDYCETGYTGPCE